MYLRLQTEQEQEQESLALASMARDDPPASSTASSTAAVLQAARRPQCAVKWDRNLKPKLAIMLQCTPVTDRRTDGLASWHKREMYILHLALKISTCRDSLPCLYNKLKLSRFADIWAKSRTRELAIANPTPYMFYHYATEPLRRLHALQTITRYNDAAVNNILLIFSRTCMVRFVANYVQWPRNHPSVCPSVCNVSGLSLHSGKTWK